MGRNDENDPLRELANLIGWSAPVKDDELEPGLVGIYDPDTEKLVTIRFLTEEEKDTLRQIASKITHYSMCKR